jgi:hypothetical protein
MLRPVLSRTILKDWDNHPITRILRSALKDIIKVEAADLIERINIGATPSTIAQEISQQKGMQIAFDIINDSEILKETILDEYIEWLEEKDKLDEENNNADSYRVAHINRD